MIFIYLCVCLLQDNARQEYTKLVSSLISAESAGRKKDTSPGESGHGGYETLIVTTDNNITKIMFNRPEKKNAINHKVKKSICEDYWFYFFFFFPDEATWAFQESLLRVQQSYLKYGGQNLMRIEYIDKQ